MVNAFVLGAVVAVLGLLIAQRWERRKPKPGVDQCCQCNRNLTPRDVHTVITRPTDAVEAEMAAWGGGSCVSAAFCAAHCPGCARKRCKGRTLAKP